MKVGILAFQGAIKEHEVALKKCGALPVQIKTADELAAVDALILPGGESTTMRRLIDRYDMLKPLKRFAASDKPIWGTCAGLILLAGKIADEDISHLGVMDIVVQRNSFGRQVDSFEARLNIKGLERPFPGVFIRAPHIVSVGDEVEVMSEFNGRTVMARQNNFLACSFHPELTDDTRVTAYFVKMIREHLEKQKEFKKAFPDSGIS